MSKNKTENTIATANESTAITKKRAPKGSRIKYVTRRYTGTKVTCLCVNPEYAEPYVDIFMLSAKIEDTNVALEKVRKQYENEKVKIVCVNHLEETEELRGIPESNFYAQSVLIDPDTRQALKSEENKEEFDLFSTADPEQ